MGSATSGRRSHPLLAAGRYSDRPPAGLPALDPARGVVGVQCTGAHGWPDHWRKLTEEKAQESLDWLRTPGTALELWSWRKIKVKRGGKAVIWAPRIQEISEVDICEFLI